MLLLSFCHVYTVSVVDVHIKHGHGSGYRLLELLTDKITGGLRSLAVLICSSVTILNSTSVRKQFSSQPVA